MKEEIFELLEKAYAGDKKSLFYFAINFAGEEHDDFLRESFLLFRRLAKKGYEDSKMHYSWYLEHGILKRFPDLAEV